MRCWLALKLFGQLYNIEARIRNEVLHGEDVGRLRQNEAVPILQALRQWMTNEYNQVRPASPIGKAIAYTLPRMDSLTIYITNARLNVDKNP